LARRATEALLRAAAARAGGAVEALDVSGCTLQPRAISHEALLPVAAANAGALQTLGFCNRAGAYPQLNLHDVEALLRAAPRLGAFQADVGCANAAEAHRLLRNEAPLGPLRVRMADVTLFGGGGEADVLALTADAAAHASLTGLAINHAPLNTAVTLNAVVDMALARRLSYLQLWGCDLTPACAPALARLLAGNVLAAFLLPNEGVQLLNVPAAQVLGNALRRNSTLTSLTLFEVGLWRDRAAAAVLLGALTAHPSLRNLKLIADRVAEPDRAVAGAAIAALVAADAPALETLDVSRCDLGDAGLGPLVDALSHNTRLRTLICRDNGASDAFAREQLLPAVRANNSLRRLTTELDSDAAREAEMLVKQRGAGHA
jgi:hypothetical protein